MSEHYFSIVRSEILPLLPERTARTLEVGCGSGNTLAWLRQVRTIEWLGGVEVSSEAAESARRNINQVWQGNIEILDLPIEAASLDLVLCLDVLEHLVDPWSVVRRLSGYLRPGGAL
ncbi:MAG: class I SAM-dependent methyltransferase, partial [Nitrospirota bacterium]